MAVRLGLRSKFCSRVGTGAGSQDGVVQRQRTCIGTARDGVKTEAGSTSIFQQAGGRC
jgi:hypothetical protein